MTVFCRVAAVGLREKYSEPRAARRNNKVNVYSDKNGHKYHHNQTFKSVLKNKHKYENARCTA